MPSSSKKPARPSPTSRPACKPCIRSFSDQITLKFGQCAHQMEIEDQVFTWSSMFSCDTSPVDTHQVLIHIDQKLRLVFRVSSVYLCQFVADVAFRRCSIRYWTFLESRCSLTSNMVRRSEGQHARVYGHSSST